LMVDERGILVHSWQLILLILLNFNMHIFLCATSTCSVQALCLCG
jgi:hypothetical protein